MLTFYRGITDELQRQIEQKSPTVKGKNPLKRDYSIYNYDITQTDKSNAPVSTEKMPPQKPSISKESNEKSDKKSSDIKSVIIGFLQSIFGEIGGRIVFVLIIIGAIYIYSSNTRS